MNSFTSSAVVLILSIAKGCADDSLFNKYSMISDIDIYKNNTIRSFASKNVLQCGTTCVKTPGCVAFFFSGSLHQCVLQDAFVEVEKNPDTSFDYQYWMEGLGDAKTTSMRERPPGYAYNGPREESCYKFGTTKKTLEDASLACQEDGSHLVYIETFEEKDLNVGLLNTTIELRDRTNYWTGGMNYGDAWRWGVDGGLVPEAITSDTRKDVHKVLKFYDDNGYLLEYSRGTSSYGYICEFELVVHH